MILANLTLFLVLANLRPLWIQICGYSRTEILANLNLWVFANPKFSWIQNCKVWFLILKYLQITAFLSCFLRKENLLCSKSVIFFKYVCSDSFFFQTFVALCCFFFFVNVCLLCASFSSSLWMCSAFFFEPFTCSVRFFVLDGLCLLFFLAKVFFSFSCSPPRPGFAFFFIVGDGGFFHEAGEWGTWSYRVRTEQLPANRKWSKQII